MRNAVGWSLFGATLVGLVLVLVLGSMNIGDSGDVQVSIYHPDGFKAQGTFHYDEATAWDMLVALSQQQGIEIASTGAGCQRYVTMIAGYESSGQGGWEYEVDGELPDYGADCRFLNDAQSITWYWVEMPTPVERPPQEP